MHSKYNSSLPAVSVNSDRTKCPNGNDWHLWRVGRCIIGPGQYIDDIQGMLHEHRGIALLILLSPAALQELHELPTISFAKHAILRLRDEHLGQSPAYHGTVEELHGPRLLLWHDRPQRPLLHDTWGWRDPQTHGRSLNHAKLILIEYEGRWGHVRDNDGDRSDWDFEGLGGESANISQNINESVHKPLRVCRW